MKKISVLFVLVLCVVLTGCGKKKLLCSYSSTDSYRGSDSILAKFTFKKDGKIDRYIVNEKVEFTDKYLKDTNSSVDDQLKAAEEYCKNSIPKTDKIKCNAVKNSNKALSVIIEYNLSDMTKEDIQKLNLSDYLESKYDDVKKQYEGQGFTCK